MTVAATSIEAEQMANRISFLRDFRFQAVKFVCLLGQPAETSHQVDESLAFPGPALDSAGKCGVSAVDSSLMAYLREDADAGL
jgi:hypothetical protein